MMPKNQMISGGNYDISHLATGTDENKTALSIVEIANTPTRLAGICLMTFPIVVFYAIFNKKLNVNLSVGGIKG